MSDEGRVHLDLEQLDLSSSSLNFSPLECGCVGQHAESVAVLVQVFLELDPAVLDPSTAVVFAPTVEDFLVFLLDLLLSTQALF